MTRRFQRNMGLLDRFLRIVAGVALIYIGFIANQLINNDIINLFLGLFGIFNVGAALIAYCPMYPLANISTWKNKPDKL